MLVNPAEPETRNSSAVIKLVHCSVKMSAIINVCSVNNEQICYFTFEKVSFYMYIVSLCKISIAELS